MTMPDSFRCAVAQMTSTADLPQNLAIAERLIADAAARGAALVALPENFAFLGDREGQALAVAESLDVADADAGPIVAMLRRAARTHAITVVAGGMPERSHDPERIHNCCAVFGPDGALIARYRKIHLFDVALADGSVHQESAQVAPGEARPVVADTAIGRLGLSVCYDVRFPELYRALVDAGATTFVVPAAFTLHTGKDHWHTLLRARAIENLAFVLAPAQVGRHNQKRVTYGHALVVDPWGNVLADAGSEATGIAVAALDVALQQKWRRELPCLQHRRVAVVAPGGEAP